MPTLLAAALLACQPAADPPEDTKPAAPKYAIEGTVRDAETVHASSEGSRQRSSRRRSRESVDKEKRPPIRWTTALKTPGSRPSRLERVASKAARPIA